MSGKVVMLATFVTYVLLGFPTPPHVIFTALALYEVLRASIGLLLPWGIQYFTDALDAIKRIEVCGNSMRILIHTLCLHWQTVV